MSGPNMKRFNDGYSGGASKRSRVGPDDFEVRILIPSRTAGSIIGKGGANIARLRTDYSARVTVPDCPGPERVLTIVAGLDNAVNVVAEVLPNLEASGGRGRRNQPEDETGDYDLRLLVHQSQAGCIIGKGGGKVKELREKTGARIKIYSNCCPNSTDRVVQINGQDNTCVDCIKEILSLIKDQAPIKGEYLPYDPVDYDEFYPDEYGGYGGSGMGGPPMGGRGGGGRGGDMRGYVDGPPPMRGGPGRRGGPDAYGGGGGYGGGYGGERKGAPPVGIGNGGGPAGVKESTQVTIPKDLAGAIIGKGGSRIRTVRMDSGADVTIDEPLPGSNDRIITITGTPSQIQMAQYLLQKCVHDDAKPGGGRY